MEGTYVKIPIKELPADEFVKLPNDLLHRILSLLPLKTIIQTCALSKQWEKKWIEFLSYSTKLEFGQEFATGLQRETYAKFLERILQRHNRDKIEKFELFFHPGNEYEAITRKWVELVVKKQVEELDLDFKGDHRDDINIEAILKSGHKYLPEIFYTCSTSLTSLRLACCSFLPPRSFNGFRFLTSISLCGVHISGESVRLIAQYSPLLEDMEVTGCGPLDAMKIYSLGLKNLTINSNWEANETEVIAPNLLSLYFVGRLSETPVLEDVSSLSEATVYVMEEFGFVCGLFWFRFLACLSHVEKLGLILKSYPGRIQNIPGVYFHNLRELSLHCFLTHDDSYDMGVFFTCCGFPRLEKLTVLLPSGNLIWMENTWNIQDPDAILHFEFRQLMEIKIVNFVGREHEMDVVELLLERTPVLETMELAFPSGMLHDLEAISESVISDRLAWMQKASPEARIVFTEYNESLE